MKPLPLVALVFLVGRAAAETAPPDRVEYYRGPVEYLSADGKVSYGKSESLVQRTVSPARARIIEEVVQPARKPGQPAQVFVTTLERVGATTRFSASDAGKTFSGTLAYTGAGWAWDAWTYDIKLAAGGGLTGQGKLDASGLSTDKVLTDAAGKPTTLVRERLARITAAQHAAQHAILLPSK